MPLTIAILLYEGMTALDAVGPLEVLRLIPGARPVLAADAEPGGYVQTDVPAVRLGPVVALEDVAQPDVILVPGGPGTAAALTSPVVPWLRSVHPGTRWTTSVCSGSLILGAAGILTGLPATSHFAVIGRLARFGAVPSSERVVINNDARVMTAAGVSAGIDMALHLALALTDPVTARAIQLIIEYAPEPPFLTEDPNDAPPEVLNRVKEIGVPQGAIPADWTL